MHIHKKYSEPRCSRVGVKKALVFDVINWNVICVTDNVFVCVDIFVRKIKRSSFWKSTSCLAKNLL